MLLSLDAGEIYSGGGSASGTRIHHNWLHDTQTPIPFSGTLPNLSRSGVYLDVDSSGFEVDQNVLWNNEYNNIFLHGAGPSPRRSTTTFTTTLYQMRAQAGYTWVSDVVNCGTTSIQDNFVLVPITQTGTTPNCSANDNNADGSRRYGYGGGSPGRLQLRGLRVKWAADSFGHISGAVDRAATTFGDRRGGPDGDLLGNRRRVADAHLPVATERNEYPWRDTTQVTRRRPPHSRDNGALFSVQVSNSLGKRDEQSRHSDYREHARARAQPSQPSSTPRAAARP